MSKQTPNSFVTCCNTIATISADDSNSDFIGDDTTIIRCQIPITSLPTKTDEGMLKGLECLLLNEPTAIPMKTIESEDESFLKLEEQCQMESEIFVDQPQIDTIVENNLAAVMLDEKMEEDYPDKENQTPFQQQINEIHLDKLENDIQYISPIISVPIGQ